MEHGFADYEEQGDKWPVFKGDLTFNTTIANPAVYMSYSAFRCKDDKGYVKEIKIMHTKFACWP